MEDRIIALEEKFSFLEHHVEELDSVVKEAFDAMNAIRKEIERLSGHIDEVEQHFAEPAPPAAVSWNDTRQAPSHGALGVIVWSEATNH